MREASVETLKTMRGRPTRQARTWVEAPVGVRKATTNRWVVNLKYYEHCHATPRLKRLKRRRGVGWRLVTRAVSRPGRRTGVTHHGASRCMRFQPDHLYERSMVLIYITYACQQHDRSLSYLWLWTRMFKFSWHYRAFPPPATGSKLTSRSPPVCGYNYCKAIDT